MENTSLLGGQVQEPTQREPILRTLGQHHEPEMRTRIRIRLVVRASVSSQSNRLITQFRHSTAFCYHDECELHCGCLEMRIRESGRSVAARMRIRIRAARTICVTHRPEKVRRLDHTASATTKAVAIDNIRLGGLSSSNQPHRPCQTRLAPKHQIVNSPHVANISHRFATTRSKLTTTEVHRH